MTQWLLTNDDPVPFRTGSSYPSMLTAAPTRTQPNICVHNFLGGAPIFQYILDSR